VIHRCLFHRPKAGFAKSRSGHRVLGDPQIRAVDRAFRFVTVPVRICGLSLDTTPSVLEPLSFLEALVKKLAYALEVNGSNANTSSNIGI
jgi:hypothetical protein